MNKPNPLVPQGSFADQGQGNVRLTVFAILGVHLVLLGVLLIAGCNKGAEPSAEQPPVDPTAVNLPPEPPPVPTDLPPAAPTNELSTAGAHATPTTPVGAAPVGAPPVTPSNTLAEVVLPPIPQPEIPPAPAFTEHTIVRGDSFYTLGKKYKVGFKAIAEANPGVDSAKLKIGQKVKIPPSKTAGAAAPAAAAVGAPADAGLSAPSGDVTHTVKSGDNLWSLSRKYGVKESAIRSANNLRTSRLVVGQKLKIPGKAAPVAPPVETAPAVPAAPPVPALPPIPAAPAAPAPGGAVPLTPQ
ncbi:MAG: hypothetical protein RJA22_985 [Verrucomicrobiota bacterium]